MILWYRYINTWRSRNMLADVCKNWKSDYWADPCGFRIWADLIADSHTCMNEAKHRPLRGETVMQQNHISYSLEQTTGSNWTVDKSVVHYRSAAVCASEAHGAWFNIQAEHKYKLPRDLLRMLKKTWGCWWEGHAPIGGFKLWYLRPDQSSLSVYWVVPSRALVLINSPESLGKEEHFNRPSL